MSADQATLGNGRDGLNWSTCVLDGAGEKPEDGLVHHWRVRPGRLTLVGAAGVIVVAAALMAAWPRLSVTRRVAKGSPTSATTERLITAPGCGTFEATCLSVYGRDAQGRLYVCPNQRRPLGAGDTPIPIDHDPICHIQTKAEADAEAEWERLLHAPELTTLHALVVCDGRQITSQQIDDLLAAHLDVRRWIEQHHLAAKQLGMDFPLTPHTAMSCSP